PAAPAARAPPPGPPHRPRGAVAGGHPAPPPPAPRGRLTQALAGIPGAAADRALEDLAHDPDRAVALTAAYLLRLRADARGVDGRGTRDGGTRDGNAPGSVDTRGVPDAS
ncbi:hypothetical protein ACFV4U_02305, partial [Streptomyces sp. NPDC059783]